MSTMKSFVLALLAVGASAPLPAADAPWSYTASVRVAVDAGGHAKVLHYSQEIPKALVASTTAKIEGWTFAPARRDGTAVGSEATLYVHFDVREVGRDYSFDVAGVDVGAGIARQVMPTYPSEAIQQHESGVVKLHVEIDSDGKPTRVVDVTDRKLRHLSAAAVDAVRRWRFDPQRVDGVAVVEPLVVPIDFRIPTSRSEPTLLSKNPRGTADAPPPSAQFAVSEQPVVKLLTQLHP